MTWCVLVGGTNSKEDHMPNVPTTDCVINPNIIVGISEYKDKCRESCANVCSVY